MHEAEKPRQNMSQRCAWRGATTARALNEISSSTGATL